jgi:two-component system sensor histidine kinase YesM
LPIYAAIAALLAMGMLATALYVKRYSRRISALSNAMGRAREGVLDQRIPPDDCRDEISMLAESFNEMCEMLEVYIEEVYVSEIKSKKSALARMDAEIRQRNARLYALQTQINPHFLYNSLESIRMRALSKGERELAQMANILSDLFRNSLKSDFVISVEDEMENCRLYAKLALLRFPDSLEIELDADGSTLCLAIPSLVLQPLVENSVNHGLRSDGRKNRITVSSRREREQGGEVLVVRVSDNGRGIEGEKLAEYRAALEEKQEQSQSIMSRRIGLANVNQRIRMLFGESWGLGIESDLGAGTIVTMRAPAVDRRKLDCRNDEIPSIDR